MARRKSTRQLQREAIAMRRKLTSKIGRINKRSDADITGSSMDIRASASEINKMNARQLRSYINRGNQFLSSRVDYVQGNRGALIPRQLWDSYQRTERAFNREAGRRLAQYSDVVLPGERQTIGSREKDRRKDRRMNNEAINRPIDAIHRDIEGIRSATHLAKLEQDLRRRLEPGYYEDSLQRARDTINKALTKMGEQDAIKEFAEMSDAELDMLWNYGGLPDSIFSRYESIMKQASNIQEDRGFRALGDMGESEIRDTLKWAQAFRHNRNKKGKK